MEIRPYDEIVKAASTAEGNASNLKCKKLKAATELDNLLGKSRLEKLIAQENFEQAVISGSAIAAAALTLKAAEETYEFHKKIYESLFGEDKELA